MNKNITFLNENYKVLLISLFLSILLWIAVTTDKDYTTRLEVPFTISRVADGYVLSNKTPDKMVLEISGNGRALFSLYFLKKEINLELPEIKKSTIIQLKDYQQRFNIAHELGVHIVDIVHPKTINLKVDRFVQAQKPVRIIKRIEPQPGYIFMGMDSEQDTVLIGGPQRLISNIKTIRTDSVIKKGVKYPFEKKVRLLNPVPGITRLEPSFVNIRFNIEELVERTIYNIPIQLVSTPDEYYASAIPATVTIRVRGGESIVAALTADKITALYNFQKQYSPGKMVYSVEIEAPEEITLLEVLPRSFRLQLKRREDVQ